MHWTFQPVGGPLFTALVVAVLLALVVIVPQPRPEGRRLWALRGLRLVIVLLTCVAMLRPTLTRIETKPLEASLLILVDDSRSMQVADSLADDSRWEAAGRMLADSVGAIKRLAEKWDVRAFRFGEEVSEITVAEGRLALPPEPTGEATGIGSALEEALDRSGASRLLGVVLLSDGAQRALPPRDTAPQIAIRRLVAEDVALYTAALGQPGGAGRADLAIEDLTASESVFVKAPTEVTARLRATGFANRTLTVQLLWEDADGEMAVVDAERVEVGPQGGAYPVRLEYTPLVAGEQKISVRIEPEEGELVTSNNQRDTFLSVRDGGVKLLYLVGAERPGGAPGLEQRFVRAALAASPDIVVTRQVYNYRQLRRSLKTDTAQGEPDVVLIDNLDATALDAASWRLLAERVQEGMGLGMIGGRQSFGPGGYRSTPLAGVLPVVIGPAQRQGLSEPRRGDVHVPGPLKLKPAEPFGLRHPILQIAAQGERSSTLWEALPELDGANKFDARDLKLNAMPIAETGDGTARNNPRPLLVVGQAGRGRVLASAVDSTWRWRLGGFSDAHRRFWRQAVLWLASKDDSTQNPVWVRLDTRLVPRGGRLDMRMGVRRDGGEEAPRDVRYEAWAQTPDDRRVDLASGGLGSGSDAETAAVFTDTRTPGDYTIQVKAYAGEQELGSTEARFNVPDQDLELDNPAAEPSLLAQLAAATSSSGGRAIAPEELPDLLQEFADRDLELEEEVVARITYWDTWPFFLLLVSLLGVEWYLRKRWGLV